MAARSLESRVSVAAIAMENGINANLLFGWRCRHLQSPGQAEPASDVRPSAVLLPVPIEAASREIYSAAPAPAPRLGSGPSTSRSAVPRSTAWASRRCQPSQRVDGFA